MPLIFHIAERVDWEAAQAAGEYRPPSLAREGFIHCSTRAQVIDTANRYYHARTDLVLLGIDAAALGPALKYEPARPPADSTAPAPAASTLPTPAQPRELFPHVYAPIQPSAVQRAAPLVPTPSGEHHWPPELLAALGSLSPGV